MRYNQVVNFALASYVSRERYTRRKTSCASSSAVDGLWHIRYRKPTMGRRYFCTRKVKADSSPFFTRSITSASDTASESAIGTEAGAPAKASSPRFMATLLTFVETPFGGESFVW